MFKKSRNKKKDLQIFSPAEKNIIFTKYFSFSILNVSQVGARKRLKQSIH